MSSPTLSAPRSAARRVAATYSVRPGWFALVVVAVGSLAAGDVPLQYQYAPLLVSVVLLGLPHGAVDHLLLARQREESLRYWLGVVSGLYLGLGVAYAVVWFVWPVGAFAFFILLTWFHWGQGELSPLRDLVGASYLRTSSQRALTVLVRGGSPMLVPLVAFPEQYELVATTLVGLFEPGAAEALAPAFEPTARAVVGALYAALVVLTLGLGYLRADTLEPWTVDAGELVLLTLFFLLVPPILAIGIYFCFWHSLRHAVRTVLLHDSSVRALERGDAVAAGRQFVRDAAPLTALSLVGLVALYLAVPRAPESVADVGGLYLVFVAVLTLPHVVVVALLDREQGLL